MALLTTLPADVVGLWTLFPPTTSSFALSLAAFALLALGNQCGVASAVFAVTTVGLDLKLRGDSIRVDFGKFEEGILDYIPGLGFREGQDHSSGNIEVGDLLASLLEVVFEFQHRRDVVCHRGAVCVLLCIQLLKPVMYVDPILAILMYVHQL